MLIFDRDKAEAPEKARRIRTLPELLRGQERFGRLIVVREAPMRGQVRRALFRCDCGTEKVIRVASVRSGAVKSCGCLQRERGATLAARTCVKHGDTFQKRRAPEYGIHQTMINRCYNARVERYPLYGGRGIEVCERWRGDGGYENFIADIGRRPSADHSLDRIDPDGNYAPGNVRWAPRSVQANNTRRNVWLTVHGVRMTVAQASARFGIRQSTLALRMKRGMAPEEAVSAPIKTGPYAKSIK